MAVNNFAPAEYGGYVLGANSGGGGGGSSVFEEWLGITQTKTATITLIPDEGIDLSGAVLNVEYYVCPSGGYYDSDYHTYIRNKITLNGDTFDIPVPLRSGDYTTLGFYGFVTAGGDSIRVKATPSEGADWTGDVAFDDVFYVWVVSGDCTLTFGVEHN